VNKTPRNKPSDEVVEDEEIVFPDEDGLVAGGGRAEEEQRNPDGFRSGFVAVAGLPNAGKSTLINAFIEGAPLITSWRPQTTRFHIRCICTNDRRQIIFVDTPGWHRKKGKLETFMLEEIARGLDGVDVLLYVIDASDPSPDRNVAIYREAVATAKGVGCRIIALAKADKIPRPRLLPLIERFHGECGPDELVPLSAVKAENLHALDEVITSHLPEGPQFYPDDILVDRPDEFVFSEFVREQLHRLTFDEVPFSLAVEVDKVSQGDKRVKIEATVYVERDSQKGIVIGGGGDAIQKVRANAAARIARFTGKKVTLSLHVKVAENWTDKVGRLRSLGYR